MNNKIFPIASYNEKFNEYLPVQFKQDLIYQSFGLEKHIFLCQMKTEITLKHYPKREPFRHKLWTVPESFYIKPME